MISVYTLTVTIMTITLSLAIMSGFFWTGGLGNRSESRLRRFLFGTKTRSLLTAHLILLSGLAIVFAIDREFTPASFLFFAVSAEVILLLIGPRLFLNWKLGPFSCAARNKIQMRLLEALEEPDDRGVLMEQTADSMIRETRKGNRASRSVLKQALQREDTIGDEIRTRALLVDSKLVDEVLGEM